MSDSRLVYSTDGGDQRRRGQPRRPAPEPQIPNDGVVRVFREKSGRRGKTVTVVRGLTGDLDTVASALKRHCGTGGSVKDGAVEIQGDQREKVLSWLQAAGYRAKAAGG